MKVILEQNRRRMAEITYLLSLPIDESLADSLQDEYRVLQRGMDTREGIPYQKYFICEEDEEKMANCIANNERYMTIGLQTVLVGHFLLREYQKGNFHLNDISSIPKHQSILLDVYNNESLTWFEKRELRKIYNHFEEIYGAFSLYDLETNEEMSLLSFLRTLDKKEQKKLLKVLDDEPSFSAVLKNIKEILPSFDQERDGFQAKKWSGKVSEYGKNQAKKVSNWFKRRLKSQEKETDKQTDYPTYLTMKHYAVNEKLLSKREEDITNKELRKYTKKIHKLARQYDKCLKGKKPNEVFTPLNNVSASYVKEACELTDEMIQYKADGYLDGAVYLQYIESLKENAHITHSKWETSRNNLHKLYQNAQIFRECMASTKDHTLKMVEGYQKVVRRLKVTGALIAVSVSLVATSLFVPHKRDKDLTDGTTIETTIANETTVPEETTSVTLPPKVEEEEKEETSEINVSFTALDDFLAKTENKEELEMVKKALEEVQVKVNANLEEKAEIQIGDFVTIQADAKVYTSVDELVLGANAQTSYYGDQKIRVVSSIVLQNELGEVCNVCDMNEYSNLILAGYHVVGYTVMNQYSLEELEVEGRYQATDVMKLVRK